MLFSVFRRWVVSIRRLQIYSTALLRYIQFRFYNWAYHFESVKQFFVGGLTAKRGKYVRPFLHTSMTGIFLIGVALAPVLKEALPAQAEEGEGGTGGQLMTGTDPQQVALTTQFSIKPNDSVRIYTVKTGETINTIAKKFQITADTIRWHNNLQSVDDIKEGQTLEIPPVTGIVHKVKRGDTIYSIAKKYEVDPQQILNYPFNTYTDDETFGLAVGQTLIVPDGIMPQTVLWQPEAYQAKRITPNAGQVSATGTFAWPTSGRITQNFVWYHTAIDVANSAAPDILAADAGTVTVAGWVDNYGYGNRVMIDHGNGFVTLYAHMQAIYVTVGQTVARGNAIGKMGSTGRSTGTHLHFEIRGPGGNQDPLQFLQ